MNGFRQSRGGRDNRNTSSYRETKIVLDGADLDPNLSPTTAGSKVRVRESCSKNESA